MAVAVGDVVMEGVAWLTVTLTLLVTVEYSAALFGVKVTDCGFVPTGGMVAGW